MNTAAQWPTRAIPGSQNVPAAGDPPGLTAAGAPRPVSRPAPLVLRWLDHGDLRTIINGRSIVFAADDVHELLELDAEQRTALAASTLDSPLEWLQNDEAPVQLYTVREVHQVIREHPSHQSMEFLPWFDEQVELLRTNAETIVVDVVRNVPAAGRETYSVSRAAKTLSHDPLLRVNVPTLWDRLEELGWIHRGEDDRWIADREQIVADHLTLLRTVIGGQKGAGKFYEQIRITPAGLDELHRLFGGASRFYLEHDAQPPLFEEGK